MQYTIFKLRQMFIQSFNWLADNKFYIAKISLTILIILLSIFIQYPNNNSVYAHYLNKSTTKQIENANYLYNKETINNFILLGTAYNWDEAQDLIKTGEVFVVIDIETGKSMNIQRTGGNRHYDVEPISTRDTELLREIWGGNFNWSRRAVLILYKNEILIASMHGMPHAGLDKYPAKALIPLRSNGFGAGVNYDIIKGNGMDGHICIHFINSTTHGSLKVDALHQYQINRVLNLQKDFAQQ